MSARSGRPVRVLDEKRRLVGVVRQERLIAFMGDAESPQEAAHA
jgi:glycine betaine/proline transport system ATP-binding protein